MLHSFMMDMRVEVARNGNAATFVTRERGKLSPQVLCAQRTYGKRDIRYLA